MAWARSGLGAILHQQPPSTKMTPQHLTVLHADHLPAHAEMAVSTAGKAMAELPPDVWGIVALAALAAEDRSFEAWTRLSLVSRAWRDGLGGAQSAGHAKLELHQYAMRAFSLRASVAADSG